jgi:2-polyprenyl-3-methyl-5-hydroxy-6-metoxy-1,4-benzoquinol methylase
MDCCAHNRGLNKVFSDAQAQADVREYLKKGLRRPSHAMLQAVVAAAGDGLAGASLLEVGGGIGALQIELLKRGAAEATNVDVSGAYVRAAQNLAQQHGLSSRVTHHQADFARVSSDLPAADIVLMHRVVCCYPHMEDLVRAAAGRSRGLLLLSHPTTAWYMQLGRRLLNAAMWISRSEYRFFLHNPQDIRGVARNAGFRPLLHRTAWPWHILAFSAD